MKRRATLVAGILIFRMLASLAGRWSGTQAQPPQTSSQGTRYIYNGKELQEPKSQFEIEWLRRRKLDQEEQARAFRLREQPAEPMFSVCHKEALVLLTATSR
jgi:hypothetical protein